MKNKLRTLPIGIADLALREKVALRSKDALPNR
jgi:hypothetical protein